MPIIHVYLAKGHSQDFKNAIAHNIQRAMIKVLGIPDDDYFQVTHEKDLNDLYFDRNFFGVKRSDQPVIICLSFNTREPAIKASLFDTIVENLTTSPGVPIEDIYMNIIECAASNWWAYARTIDPETGFDSRTKVPSAK